MGCASSTEVITDPITGHTREKKKLGGAYPGNRPPQHAPYTPAPDQFHNGQAVAHFVSYGGGNALVLQNEPKPQPASVGKPEYIQVTLPAGVNAGDKIHVQAPNGYLNEIIVPSGMGAGSTFTVQFEHGPGPPPPKQMDYNPPLATATHASTTTTTSRPPNNNNNNNSGEDDGFASGFNNPYQAPATDEPTYTASGETYTPSYSAPPSYPPPPKY